MIDIATQGVTPCQCGSPQHPRIITNPSGRDRLDYRVGDFATFREAMLRSLNAEAQLGSNWRPGAEGDLAVQMIEWWAYLADILTLYNEQIAQQAFLRTVDEANHPDALRQLVRLLGYRPSPGLAATAVLAGLIHGPGPVKLRHGFQVRSKATPGKPPQIFELDQDAILGSPDVVPLDPPPKLSYLNTDNFLLKGAVSTIRRGSDLVVVAKNGVATGWEFATVKDIAKEKGPRHETNTRVFLTQALGQTTTGRSTLPSGAKPDDYKVLYTTLATNLWTIVVEPPLKVESDKLHLATTVRQIRPLDLVLLYRDGATPVTQLATVTSYSEAIQLVTYDPNGNPSKLPVLHSELAIDPKLANLDDWNNSINSVEVRYGFREAGLLIAPPAQTYPYAGDASPADLTAVYPSTVPPAQGGITLPFLLEDANGNGTQAVGRPAADGSGLTNVQLTPRVSVSTPLRGLFNQLNVSRGETVRNEMLGRGDATRVSQEFVLKKFPLTYLSAPGTVLGYRSTLQITVDGIAWAEAPSFYGQSSGARIFVTREDAAGKTHVMFGDGVNGASLPSGAAVVASYRTGSGAIAPDQGALTGIARPFPGLKGIRNPIPAGGGKDPDPPDKVRRYAPRSVLTFGRAVSAGDYEAIAAQAPGVSRARAYWTWNDDQQRNSVTVFVGDDDAAVSSAQVALAGTEDPNRPVDVQKATGIGTGDLILRIQIPAAVDPKTTWAALDTALFDDVMGLFGVQGARIGQAFFSSQIVAACMTVRDVVAVELVNFIPAHVPGHPVTVISGVLYDPGVGCYFKPDLNNRYYLLESV